VNLVGIRNLSRGEAKWCHDAPDAPDAGDEAEPLQVLQRGHHGLLAAPGKMGKAL